MKLALTTAQEYRLTKHEFEEIGDRNISGYTFNLEIKDGKLVNNIRGTAVARDLFEVLKSSRNSKELMSNNHFKINMNVDFKLKIQIIK
jgi:hypothetical protein